MAVKNRRPAERGDYGTPVPSLEGRLADLLWSGIDNELDVFDSFTRDDLLHLDALSYVSTITRYRYVLAAVDVLVERGDLIKKNRTDLVVFGRSKQWKSANTYVEEHYEELLKIVRGFIKRHDEVTVMMVADAWSLGLNMTRGVKRTIVRKAMERFCKDKHLMRAAPGRYSKRSVFKD